MTALVSGTEIYDVEIAVTAVPQAQWRAICRDSAGAIDSVVELLQGKLSTSVMARLCRQGTGLFPTPREIRMSCSCPDSAAMCKHIAAVLYGIGVRLDHAPALLFTLRKVDAERAHRAGRRATPPEEDARRHVRSAPHQRRIVTRRHLRARHCSETGQKTALIDNRQSAICNQTHRQLESDCRWEISQHPRRNLQSD